MLECELQHRFRASVWYALRVDEQKHNESRKQESKCDVEKSKHSKAVCVCRKYVSFSRAGGCNWLQGALD